MTEHVHEFERYLARIPIPGDGVDLVPGLFYRCACGEPGYAIPKSTRVPVAALAVAVKAAQEMQEAEERLAAVLHGNYAWPDEEVIATPNRP